MTRSAITSQNYDAVVVGGGPNGLALALALGGPSARPKARVLVVDARDPRNFANSGTDTRGSALTVATQNMFKALGCWADLSTHVAEVRDIIVTDGNGNHQDRPALLSFVTDETHKPAAVITENRAIAWALMAAVDRSPDVALWANVTITKIETDRGPARITFADGVEVHTPLLIGADGRNSFVRQLAGIAVDGHQDNQTALTFTMSHELPHGHRAEEHFSPTGVFAVLPLPGNHSSIVWGTSPEEAGQLMALDDSGFEDALNAKVGDHLGRVKLEGLRQAYPLKRQVAKALTASRTALVGDAAHIIHPLAGLGLNLGFKDVAALAECVGDALRRGEDHGSAQVLERYESWRRFDIISTIAAMEAMNALFVNDWPMLSLLRRTGLQLVDRMPAVKSILMTEAAGMTGTLPRLMRGI